MELQPGEVLYDLQSSKYLERGLFFIEEGILKVERDRRQKVCRRGTTAYRQSTFSFSTNSSLTSRSEFSARDSALKSSRSEFSPRDSSLNSYSSFGDELQTSPQKEGEFPSLPTTDETFRLARLGEGWVVGTMEFFFQRKEGIEIAVDECKLHHLPFSKIEEVEEEDPGLVLELYKLLSYLMAERQEATIGQLATLHSIMSSPACS